MKAIFTSILSVAFGITALAQTQITNPGFEDWGGNPSPPTPASKVSHEPNHWYSNESGSTTARLGPQTCFKDNAIFHGGATAVRVETTNFIIAVVNGNVTTGVINAPSSDKHTGYIGTINYSDAADIRRMPFHARPDSIVGWYKYTQAPTASSDMGTVKTILHVGNYYDPEVPVNGNHPDSSMNKVGVGEFTTPASSVSNWTRFSVPFTYVNATDTPDYVMINITSSKNQLMDTAGSIMWVDDLTMIYNPPPQSVNNVTSLQNNVKAYSYNKIFYVDFMNRNNNLSTVSVYDLSGRKILSETIQCNNLHSFDMTQYNSGIYLYHIYSNGESRSGKFFVD